MNSLWKPANEDFTEAEQAEPAADLAAEHVAFHIEPEERDGVAGHVLTALPEPTLDPDIPEVEFEPEPPAVPHVDAYTLRPYV